MDLGACFHPARDISDIRPDPAGCSRLPAEEVRGGQAGGAYRPP